MTTEFASDYIQRRMCELGYGSSYTLRFRHLVLQPGEKRNLSVQNQLFVLVGPLCDLRIESNTGVFDLSEDQANELQYEHSGDVYITNQSLFINHTRFIQVIPKFCKTSCL